MKLTILGLGYIGLPTAAMFANRGYDVLGIDIDEEKVDEINRGHFRIEEPGLKAFLRDAKNSGNFKVSTKMEDSDVFIITVPTPLKENKAPDLSYVESAAEMISKTLKKDNLVVLESTVPPGTTIETVIPILEKSGLKSIDDFKVAYCPERVMPGKILKELTENDRIIGGIDEESRQRAKKLYSSFVEGKLYLTNPTTAEFVKLAENTYRDVNIALANEFAKLCEKHPTSVWDVVKLANNHPRVYLHKPGPGVGGHCLPIDPWFLVDEDAELIPTSRKINDEMVDHVIKLIEKHAPEGQIAVLGASYKANTEDTRSSPTLQLLKKLHDRKVKVHDPYVSEYDSNLDSVIEGTEAIVLMVDHKEYNDIDPRILSKKMKGNIIIDTKNCLEEKEWTEAGFKYVLLGSNKHD